MARQRLTAVLAEQKERDAAEQAAAEQAKQSQLSHILALKYTLNQNDLLHKSQHAAAIRARRQHAQQQRDERQQLEAKGVNADGVFMAREEAERRQKEAERQRKADVEARRRIEANIKRELDERLERERREEEKRTVKEKLRMKVSRNLIEVTALQLAQQQQRQQRRAERHAQRVAQQQQESKESLLPALIADDGEEEAEDAEGEEVVQSPHARFLEWQQRHSPSHTVSSTELLHYQRQQHTQKLTTALTGMRDRHLRHQREAIMGKQYHNEPLLSEPSLLHFIDYVPGTTVTRPVTITNTSFSFNTIQPQPQPLSSPLSLTYVPAGRLSSGQSFTLTATYKSDNTADESGTIDFVAESGPFQVQWKASRRQAVVAIEESEVSVECVRGEKKRKQWHIKNDGAIPVRWTVTVLNVQGKWREDDDDELTAAGQGDGSGSVGVEEGLLGRSGFPFHMALEGELQGYSKQQVSVLFQPVIPASLTVDCIVTITPLTVAAADLTEKKTDENSVAVPDSSVTAHETPADASVSSSNLDAAETSSSSFPVSFPSLASATNTSTTAIVSFPLRLIGLSHDLPIHLTDSTLRFGTVLSNRLYRSALHLTNRSNAPLRFTIHCPPALRSVISFSPALGFLQAEGQAVVGVRVEVARGDEEKVWKEAWRLRREVRGTEAGVDEAEEESERKKLAIDVPLTVEVSGQSLPLHWNLRARLTTSILSLSTSTLSFPATLIGQASALPLVLTNHSPLLQKLHLSVPPGFAASFTSTFSCSSSSHPSHCFINLLPLRSFTTTIIFSPTAASPYSGRLLLRSDVGDEYRLHVEGRGEEGGVVVEGGGEVRLAAVVDGDSEQVGVMLRNDESEEVAVEVYVPEGRVRGNRSESSFLSLQPRVLRLAAHERRRLLLTFAPNIAAQVAEETLAQSRLSVLTEEAENDGATTARSTTGRPSKASVVTTVSQPDPKQKKPKKLTADEQKRADEEAKRLEQQRLVQQAEEQQRREEEERRREVERVYNSPEARRQRELEHPGNKLAADCWCQWSVEEKGEPWSRHARHRVAVFYRSVKAVAVAQAAAAAASTAVAEVSAGSVNDAEAASSPPAVPPAVEVVPRVTYLTLHTCVVQPTLLVEPAVVSFGRIAVGEHCKRTVRVTNSSETTISLTVDHFNLSSPFRLLSLPSPLPPLQSATLTFVFEPSAASQSHSRVYVRSATTRSQLSFEGEAFLPSFTVSTTKLHTGHCLPGGSSSRQLTVTNTSSSALPLSLRLCGWQPQSLACLFAVPVSSLVLQPNAPHPLVVRFTPQHEGRYSCRLWLAEREEVELVGSCSDWAVAVEVDSREEEMHDVWNVMRRVEESMTFEVRNRDTTTTAIASAATDKPAKEKEAKDKSAKSGKGGKDGQSVAVTPAALANEAVYLPIKATLYDTVCANPRPRVVVLDCEEQAGIRYSRAFCLYMSASADNAAAASSATIEWSVTQRDVMDNFFSVEPSSTATIKSGEEVKGCFVFHRQRYDEWRRGRGVELLGYGLGGGGWLESEVKCVMKVGGGGGGKNDTPAAVRAEYFVVRVFID